MYFINTDSHHRVWPTIQDLNGFTLALNSGATADLDLPKDFRDPYLKVVRGKSVKKKPIFDRVETEPADPTPEHPKEKLV